MTSSGMLAHTVARSVAVRSLLGMEASEFLGDLTSGSACPVDVLNCLTDLHDAAVALIEAVYYLASAFVCVCGTYRNSVTMFDTRFSRILPCFIYSRVINSHFTSQEQERVRTIKK